MNNAVDPTGWNEHLSMLADWQGKSVDPSEWVKRQSLLATGWGDVNIEEIKSYIDARVLEIIKQNQSQLPTFATVAKTGNYSDLNNKPELKRVATTGSYNDLTGRPEFSAVATSGRYDDLTGRPTFSQVAKTGNYNDLNGRPNLHKVATTGSYNDLKDKPSQALNTADYVVYKKIFSYIVDDFEAGQELIKEIPLDFNKYWKIIVDAHYESGERAPQRWDFIQAIVNNPPMTLANCLQVGAQHESTNRAPVIRTLDQVVAVWTVAHYASSYHIEIMVNNELKNFPMYRAESFGGTTGNLFTQEISGRIMNHPRNITALKVMLNRPEKGGKIVAYGVEK